MRKLLLVLVFSGLAAVPVIAAPMNPPNIPANMREGAINAHDMQMLRTEQFEKRKQNDLKILKDNQKQQDITVNDEIQEAKKKESVIKAKVEEFQTKGVYIESIKFPPSRILTERELEQIAAPLLGTNVSFEQINDVVAKINLLYSEKGFVTARAFLPPQIIENGVVRIEFIEGTIGKIDIDGNQWTKEGYIKARISEKSGDVFDIAGFEKDVVKFNRYNDGIQLKADLYAGEAEHTTDITLTTAEKLPFHLTGLFDNAGRSTIGILRGGVIAQADSLFGYRDKLSIGTYMSKASLTPFADYNIPVNKYDGRVGFTFSSSHSSIINGPYEMFDIESRSYNYALYYTHPLVRKPFFELNSYIAGNYKQATTSFDKFDLYTDKITSAQASLNARYDTKRGIWYGFQEVYHAFPIIEKQSKYFKYSGGLTRLHDFGHGIVLQLRANYQYVPNDVIPYVDQFQSGGIATVRGYSEGLLIGKSGYFMNAEMLFPILPQNITISVKRKPGNLHDVNNLKNIGKNANADSTQSVTLLNESESGSNDGFIAILEKEAKNTLRDKKTVPFLGRYVKGILFVDHACVMPFKGRGPGQEGLNINDALASIGAGLRIQMPGDFTARLYWGFPMINNSHDQFTGRSTWGRFHFELSLAPDFDKLLKMRKRNINL